MIRGKLHEWSATLTPLNYVSLTRLSNFCSGSISLKGELENWDEFGHLRTLVWGEGGISLDLMIYSPCFNQRVHIKAETSVQIEQHSSLKMKFAFQ